MAVSNQPNIMDELKTNLQKIFSEALLQPAFIADLRKIFLTEFKRQDVQNRKEQGDEKDDNMTSSKTKCTTQPNDHIVEEESSQFSPTQLIDTLQREHNFHRMASTTNLQIKAQKHIQSDHHKQPRQPDHSRHQRQSRHTDKKTFTVWNIHVGSKKTEKHEKYRKPSTSSRKAKVKYKIKP